jgi:DNA invertase Pin-like site-specific DNA recombinase
MAKFGYARVSTREQSTDHQYDALLSAGIEPGNIFIEKISGKLSSRPKLDVLLDKLRKGDVVVVTRLRRLGRNHAHLLELVARFDELGVDFVVLEQGIDTSTPGGRLVFRLFAALAEYDRELIVEGTLDGLAAARSRGRVGGRRPKLTQRQLDQAQLMYDSGEHTVEEIAATFNVARTTMYRQLNAYGTGADCALIVYRNSKPKIDENNRRYGETGAGEDTQLDADRKWWNVAPTRRPRLKAIVYVVDGTVARVRAVQPDGKWGEDDRRYADVPVSGPLTDTEIATQLPTLNLHPGDPRPHQRGKLREYVTL